MSPIFFKPSTIVLVLLCVFTVPRVLSATPQPEKIAQVAEGKLTEAKASWWGFDSDDSTAFLKAALDSKVSRLIIDKQAGPWITGPLQLRGEMEIVFEEGVEVQAKPGLFHGKTDFLISASNIANIKLVGLGSGATLRMHKADYHTEAYTKSEWRHGIALRSVENVTVENLAILSTGGDGIYLGVATRGKPCRNVTIRKVLCDDNNRQGISVISADKLLIEDCILKNTWGTPPAAGIDFEPNLADEQLTDCVMRRCTVESNHGDGIVFYLPNLRETGPPVTVRLEQCVVRSGRRYGFHFITRDTPESTLKGHCELIDCRFENCEAGGIAINRKAVDGIAISMKNTAVVHCGDDAEKTAPILLSMDEFDDFGGIDFGDITIVDANDRSPLRIAGMAALPQGITGTLRLRRDTAPGTESDAVAETVRLNETWLAREYPRRLRKIPLVELDPKKYVPQNPEAAATMQETADGGKLPVVWLRKEGTFWMYAEKGKPLDFAIAVRRIGSSEIGQSRATLILPDGEEKKWTISPEEAKEFAYRLDKAPETGVYRLHVDVGVHALRMLRCNRPTALPASPRIDLISSPTTFYFTVPERSHEFGIRVRGAGGEAVKAGLYDPSGERVWGEDDITEAVQFDRKAEDGKIAGIWKVVLEKPGRLPFEDNSITLLGVPSLLAFSPEHLFVPVGEED